MIILGLDTASSIVSMGLIEGKRVLGELTFRGERRHLSRLIPWLHCLLSETGIPLPKIEGMACVIGPGSFTGLRIGLSTVQGISLALQIPAVRLTSLDVLAKNAASTRICVLIHSRSDTFFYAFYENSIRQGEIRVASLDEIISGLPQDVCLVSSDLEVFRNELETKLARLPYRVSLVNALVSGVRVAQMGETAFAQGEAVSAEHLTATYLRSGFAEEKTQG
jgi:tRNA threonylcarbamoyl adenosine modification protein YeaZ